MSRFDSIIFDMDGTLWDAVDSYCEIWNRTSAELAPAAPTITRDHVIPLMGTPIDAIYNVLIGEAADRDAYLSRLHELDRELMPVLGGRLYDGVAETVAELAKTHRLFLLSNCDTYGLPNFLAYTGLTPYFEGHLSYGQTGCDKDVNLRRMVERYGLKSPVYVGDTAGDMRSTHAAGLPFVWADYGFYKDLEGYDFRIGQFSDLLKLI